MVLDGWVWSGIEEGLVWFGLEHVVVLMLGWGIEVGMDSAVLFCGV